MSAIVFWLHFAQPDEELGIDLIEMFAANDIICRYVWF